MKKYILPFLLIFSLTLTACGNSTLDDAEVPSETVLEEAPGRPYNENMSLEEFETVTYDTIEFATDISDVFSQMAAMSEKYADTINSSETFDWSQYWDFREAKADAITTCDEILNYDESICSKEYQICVDECKSMAFQIEAFFNTVSKEMDVNALSVLTQNLSNVVTVGMNNASVYQTMATVAYMEANDGDQAKIQELKQKVADNYIYQATTGAGNSASGAGQSALQKIVFTNDYGTSTTKCAHASCTNAIATSGDTNCCIIHSNKCFNCSKYVDEDTMFCTSCEAMSSKGSSDASSDSSSDTCRYQYPNGTVCGDAAIRGMVLCPTHFTELYKIYRSLHGK